MVKSYHHDSGRKVDPADGPELARSEIHHLLDAVAKALSAKEPGYRDGLEEAHPQQGNSTGRVEVHELENVGSALKSTPNQKQ
jgi:hypothetical protein